MYVNESLDSVPDWAPANRLLRFALHKTIGDAIGVCVCVCGVCLCVCVCGHDSFESSRGCTYPRLGRKSLSSASKFSAMARWLTQKSIHSGQTKGEADP